MKSGWLKETYTLLALVAAGNMKNRFDWIAALIVVALIASIMAFASGLVPYPYGWIVLSLLLVFRLTARSKSEQ